MPVSSALVLGPNYCSDSAASPTAPTAPTTPRPSALGVTTRVEPEPTAQSTAMQCSSPHAQR
ncbi:hypothetical protein EJ03DRAFT_328108 [Teratosphaeria nubilosa]|uniref:Uncharacterized protein n=1 Tax=Teratosphaeria nubilosa TaxID=161662 RepID=A0A6G1L6R0_9PEZI|nr:hypothetical protein EJ03DRAFT_328108 [Teratosphaeria nubilosa]